MGLLALALLIQGFVGAAHFHNLAALQSGQTASVTGALPGQGGTPSSDLPANLPDGHNADCAICHLSGMASASAVPAAALLPPAASATMSAPSRDGPPVAPVTAHHAPRGPPNSFVQS